MWNLTSARSTPFVAHAAPVAERATHCSASITLGLLTSMPASAGRSARSDGSREDRGLTVALGSAANSPRPLGDDPASRQTQCEPEPAGARAARERMRREEPARQSCLGSAEKGRTSARMGPVPSEEDELAVFKSSARHSRRTGARGDQPGRETM